MKKKLFGFFFVLLVLHIGLVVPKAKFECSCHVLSPDAFSPCCNCPYCVEKRGGFLSACSCHERTEKPLGNVPLIKRVTCFCSATTSDFDLPGLKYPVLLTKDLFLPPAFEIHHLLSIPFALSSQVYLTPPDHPT